MAPDDRGSIPSEEGIFDEISPILRKGFDDLFGTRARLNRELWDILQVDKIFLRDIDEIRQREGVPKLRPSSDFSVRFVSVDEGEIDVANSDYFDALDSKRKKRIETALKSLLVSYSLPLNFYEKVWYVLLYRKFPKGAPRYNWDFLDQIIEDPKEAQRLPISTAEKKFWLAMFRHRLGIKKGRVPKEYAKAYSELQDLLSSSPKNRHRRMRTFDSAMEAFEHDGSSVNLAVELIPTEEATKEKELRLAATIRQRKSRLLKRNKKVEN